MGNGNDLKTVKNIKLLSEVMSPLVISKKFFWHRTTNNAVENITKLRILSKGFKNLFSRDLLKLNVIAKTGLRNT